ncbi:MAG: AMP-binding protein, partial [Candidatus Bathyarchaeota archaeon]|nr:AMP-binding protein [Candidatus Bathyarchaeota archaeon]
MQIENQPWLRSWPPDVPRKLKYPKVPLQGLLEKAAKAYPEKAAVAFAGREITYAELDALSNQFAAALAVLGVKKGDRVAVFMPNMPQFVISYYGTLRAGAILTAISPLHKEREVEYQLNDAEAETIVALDTLYPIVESIRRKTKLKNIILASAEEYAAKTSTAPIRIEEKPNVYRFQELLEKSKEVKPPTLRIDPEEDLAALQYTGGTTGTPKGAMLTHLNLVSNAIAFAAWIKGTVGDTFLAALPLFHIYGMTTSMNVPVYLAAKMVLMPRFEPTAALETIQRHRVTVFCGVPTMYSLLLANPALSSFDLTSIRVCISGASPLPPRVQKLFMEVTGGFLAEGYGLTEASPVTHCNPVDK